MIPIIQDLRKTARPHAYFRAMHHRGRAYSKLHHHHVLCHCSPTTLKVRPQINNCNCCNSFPPQRNIITRSAGVETKLSDELPQTNSWHCYCPKGERERERTGGEVEKANLCGRALSPSLLRRGKSYPGGNSITSKYIGVGKIYQL